MKNIVAENVFALFVAVLCACTSLAAVVLAATFFVTGLVEPGAAPNAPFSIAIGAGLLIAAVVFGLSFRQIRLHSFAYNSQRR